MTILPATAPARVPSWGRVSRALVATFALALFLAACGDGNEEGPAEPSEASNGDAGEQGVPADPAPEEDAEPDGNDEAEPAPAADDEPDDAAAGPEVDPAEVGADELGVVPVMMYHQIREDGGSEWDMSPEEFREELTKLFDRGFVPITTADLVRGNIDIPAGRSPVVLTFDDSPRNQARLEDDGSWAPDTAMGILTDVAAQYDEVEPIASFYLITSSMFGAASDAGDIVQALHDRGVELGNHTHGHANLRAIGPDEVQDELAQAVAEITEIVPDAEVVTMSLPFGISPEDRDLLAEGSSDAGSYTNEAALLVGDRPAPSPFHADFAPMSVPRIKTLPDPDDEFGSAWWLEVIASSDSWRPYISDGDPNTISFPAEREEELDPAYADRANPY